MKIFVAALIMAVSLAGCAGMKTLPPGELTVRKVIEVPGMTKEMIFEESKLWVARNFKPYKAVRLFGYHPTTVIEYANEQKGILIATGTIYYPGTALSATQGYKRYWEVTFTMEEDIRDGRIRVTFSNLGIYVPKIWCGNIYSEWLGAYDKPLTEREDMAAVKPVLDGLAENLGDYLRVPEKTDNW